MRPADKKTSVENVTDESESLREPPKPHTLAPLEEGDRTFVIFVDQRMETISAGSTVSQQLAKQAAEFAPVKCFDPKTLSGVQGCLL